MSQSSPMSITQLVNSSETAKIEDTDVMIAAEALGDMARISSSSKKEVSDAVDNMVVGSSARTVRPRALREEAESGSNRSSLRARSRRLLTDVGVKEVKVMLREVRDPLEIKVEGGLIHLEIYWTMMLLAHNISINLKNDTQDAIESGYDKEIAEDLQYLVANQISNNAYLTFSLRVYLIKVVDSPVEQEKNQRKLETNHDS
ncbi:hypothetical protein K501DRAFT_299755 [Backusella circina FSU 941]|nr:hypothetical protein K501DRAFT_299755 [Backusella circina FSU 941]